ncbi:MAG: methyltransferase domain-containing protein [Cyclobacteriaceae bacterium]
MNLSVRSSEIEIMDDLNISGEVVPQTLKELNTINQYLGGNRISMQCFKKIIKKKQVNSLVDLGCGGADILIQMAKNSSGTDVQFVGIDANPHIVEYAQRNTSAWSNIEVSCANILEEAFQKQSFDIIHCCLFLHHFTEKELIHLFVSFKKQARKAIIVNDLHRHFLAYHSIRLITRFFSKSFMVRNDAAVSVARGFKRSELTKILEKAGISNYSLKWRWAFRWQLIITCD